MEAVYRAAVGPAQLCDEIAHVRRPHIEQQCDIAPMRHEQRPRHKARHFGARLKVEGVRGIQRDKAVLATAQDVDASVVAPRLFP